MTFPIAVLACNPASWIVTLPPAAIVIPPKAEVNSWPVISIIFWLVVVKLPK